MKTRSISKCQPFFETDRTKHPRPRHPARHCPSSRELSPSWRLTLPPPSPTPLLALSRLGTSSIRHVMLKLMQFERECRELRVTESTKARHFRGGRAIAAPRRPTETERRPRGISTCVAPGFRRSDYGDERDSKNRKIRLIELLLGFHGARFWVACYF